MGSMGGGMGGNTGGGLGKMQHSPIKPINHVVMQPSDTAGG